MLSNLVCGLLQFDTLPLFLFRVHSLQNLEGRFVLLSVPVADVLLNSSTVCS